MSKNIFIVFIAIILNSCSNAQTNRLSSQCSAPEFSEKIQRMEDAVIVDVRTPEEFKNGHIANALNLNWNSSEFDKQLATLDKNKTVFVYCLSGGRSGSAADKMRQSGFEHVIEMAGGIMEWRANNLPETKITTTTKDMSLEQYQSLLHSDKWVLIDFYASWCAPCKRMKPFMEKLAIEMADKVTLIRIDADEHAELCQKLNIAALPVLKLYKGHQLIWENTGYIEEEQVKEQLK